MFDGNLNTRCTYMIFNNVEYIFIQKDENLAFIKSPRDATCTIITSRQDRNPIKPVDPHTLAKTPLMIDKYGFKPEQIPHI